MLAFSNYMHPSFNSFACLLLGIRKQEICCFAVIYGWKMPIPMFWFSSPLIQTISSTCFFQNSLIFPFSIVNVRGFNLWLNILDTVSFSVRKTVAMKNVNKKWAAGATETKYTPFHSFVRATTSGIDTINWDVAWLKLTFKLSFESAF